jgi:hypothetical protein
MVCLTAGLYCGLKRWPVLAQNQPAKYSGTVYATYQFHTLSHPTGLVAATWGNGVFDLFIADTSNNRVRKFEVPAGGSGTLTALAGNGTAGYT